MIVVDANVSLKWFLPEDGMAEAFSLLRSGRKPAGPWIIRDEVVSGSVRRVRRKELAAEEARACVADWMQELRRETVHLINEESLLLDAGRNEICAKAYVIRLQLSLWQNARDRKTANSLLC